MSRLDLARLLMIAAALVATAVVCFRLILRRERHRRAHWSTRTRASNPHWSIVLASRIERLGSLSTRHGARRSRRKKNL